jgi:hypothetical protein
LVTQIVVKQTVCHNLILEIQVLSKKNLIQQWSNLMS